MLADKQLLYPFSFQYISRAFLDHLSPKTRTELKDLNRERREYIQDLPHTSINRHFNPT